ncbi:MAG: zinc ribbon domain-containing protein [Candidatus Aminicenantales bacterium]
MAIRRCPYCKAIIDESDKYCNNCGTQLLFPEDEFVEEDIPGDKIIEEEEQEIKDEEEEELGEGWRKEEEAEEQEEEYEEEEEGDEEAESWGKGRAEEERAAELEEKEEKEEEEEESEEESDLEGRKKYEVALEDDELIFKTKDLEKLPPAVDEGKKEVEEFIASYLRKEGEGGEEGEEEKVEEQREKSPGQEVGEELPLWTTEMRKVRASAIESEGGEEEEIEEETESWEEKEIEEKTASPPPPGYEWTRDSGIGVPESVTPSGLLFTDSGTVAAAEASAERMPGREVSEEKRKEMREELPREIQEEEQPSAARLFLKIKSKFVDLIFITAVWLISLWFTAQVIDVSFFRLFAKSPLPILGFYFILLLLYFFLFLYFLGETLGDHYFSGED